MPRNVYQPSESAILQLQVGEAIGIIVDETILDSHSYGESFGEFYITVRNTGDIDGVFRVEIWDRTVTPWVVEPGTITKDVPIPAGGTYAFRYGDIAVDPTFDGDTFDFYPRGTPIGEIDGSYNLVVKRREGFWPFFTYVQTDTYLKTIVLLVVVATAIIAAAIQDAQGNPITVADLGQQIQIVGMLVEAATEIPVDTIANDRIWISRRLAAGAWVIFAQVGSGSDGTFTSGIVTSPDTAGTYEYRARFIGESQALTRFAPSEVVTRLGVGVSVVPAVALPVVVILASLGVMYLTTR